jgi:Tfp pilus assembly protein PilN
MRAVNLIPGDQRERTHGLANRSHGAAYMLLGVLAGIAVLALLYGVDSRQVASKEGEARKVTQQAQTTAARAASLAPYKSFVAMNESREQDVKMLVDSRFDWAHSLAELGRVLPPGTSISTLTGTIAAAGLGGSSNGSAAARAAAEAATVHSATPPGSVPSFALAGCATSQSVVAHTVTQLELIDGVGEVALNSSTKGEAGGGGSSSAGSACPFTFSITVTFQALPPTPTGSAAFSAQPSGAAANASDSAGSQVHSG